MQFIIQNLMGLMLVSIAIMAFIVSLTIQEKKRFRVALGLSGVMLLIGLYGWGKIAWEQVKFEKRLAEIRKEHTAGLEQMRDRIQKDSKEDKAGTRD